MPIVYLPNVGRQTLRRSGDCRSCFSHWWSFSIAVPFGHNATAELTVEAFLISDDGLGWTCPVTTAREIPCTVLYRCFPETPSRSWRASGWRRKISIKLMVGDQPRDLLEWI